MDSKLNPYIIELESKIRILERENESLSSKVEENLLLNRAFEEINSYEDIDNLLLNTLENISILLDIQFSGIFDLEDDHFICRKSFALFSNNDTLNIDFQLSEAYLERLSQPEFTSIYLTSGFQFKYTDKVFEPYSLKLISLNSEIYSNRYFVFINDHTGSDISQRGSLLEKVLRVISARLDRIYFQMELQKLNDQLQLTNEELNEKSQIINEQNSELLATLQHLRDTQSKLVQSEKMASLGVLTAGVAHEINNPLNFIMGGYTGLSNYYADLGQPISKDVETLLSIIKSGIDRTSKIMNSLTSFSRDQENNREEYHINEVLDNCVTMLNHKMKNRIKLIKNYGPETPLMYGNVGKLHQVFLNIINNAIQSIADKGEISIIVFEKPKELLIEIKDNGCGISEENLSKITDPFFTTKPPGEGTGLGLSISYSIIKDHMGELNFQSTENIGTSVQVILPKS